MIDFLKSSHLTDLDEINEYGWLSQLFDYVKFALINYLPEWLAGFLTFIIVGLGHIVIFALLFGIGVSIDYKIFPIHK